LNDDFRHTKLACVVIAGQEYPVAHWQEVLVTVCRYLATQDSARLRQLASEERLTSRTGRILLTTDADFLDVALATAEGVYADEKLMANYIRNNMRRLLEAFDLDPATVRIYLRGDGTMDAAADI
jgi:hypothetical protein